MKKITWKTYFKAFCVTSIPLVALSYLYGVHGVLIYTAAFVLGMMFQANISLWKFAKIILSDLKREFRYYRCRLKRHKLIVCPSQSLAEFYPNYLYCEECKSLVRRF